MEVKKRGCERRGNLRDWLGPSSACLWSGWLCCTVSLLGVDVVLSLVRVSACLVWMSSCLWWGCQPVGCGCRLVFGEVSTCWMWMSSCLWWGCQPVWCGCRLVFGGGVSLFGVDVVLSLVGVSACLVWMSSCLWWGCQLLFGVDVLSLVRVALPHCQPVGCGCRLVFNEGVSLLGVDVVLS